MCRYGAAFHGATHARRDTFHCLLHSSRPFLSSSVFLARSAANNRPWRNGVGHRGPYPATFLALPSPPPRSRPLRGVRRPPAQPSRPAPPPIPGPLRRESFAQLHRGAPRSTPLPRPVPTVPLFFSLHSAFHPTLLRLLHFLHLRPLCIFSRRRSRIARVLFPGPTSLNLRFTPLHHTSSVHPAPPRFVSPRFIQLRCTSRVPLARSTLRGSVPSLTSYSLSDSLDRFANRLREFGCASSASPPLAAPAHARRASFPRALPPPPPPAGVRSSLGLCPLLSRCSTHSCFDFVIPSR